MSTANTLSRPLDDDSLAMLLDEVCAMAASGRPLVSALADLDDRSLGRLGNAANSVRTDLEHGKSAAVSIAGLSKTYQAPIRVAMEVLSETGSTEPIYETVRLIREANEDRRQFRIGSINPILNVIVASAVLFLVMPWILVSLSEAELIKTAFSPTVTEICQTFVKNFTLAAGATVALVGVFAFLVYQGLSRSPHDLHRSRATFCRWIAIQIDSPGTPGELTSGGPELGRVIAAAADVAGPAMAQSWTGVAENIRSGSKTAASLAMPDATPEPLASCIVDLVSGKRDGKSVAFDLRRLSDLYSQKARHHRTWWTDLFPRWVSWILMITIMVILLRAILMPLLEVVGEVLS